MSGCLCSMVTIAWSPPDRGSGHPFRSMAKDSVSDHALYYLPTPCHTRPASWGTTAALMYSVCWQGVDYKRKGKALSVIFAFTQFSFSHHPIKVPAVFLPIFWLMPLCSQAYRQARAWARKAHISQFASCFDTELRLCLNNLYLPPDIRIDIIWVPGTAAFHTRSEAP